MDRAVREGGAAPALPESLAALLPRLAAGLAVLDERHHLIVSVGGSGRYVQFAMFGPNLRGESVGNVYLEGPERLTSPELAWLAGHGWNDPDDDGNHWRHWEPSDPLAAATVALVTLHVVHGVTDARRLVFDSDDTGVAAHVSGARP